MTLYIQPYTFRSPFDRMLRRWMPAVDGSAREQYLDVNVCEEDDAYVLSALVPGLQAEDLNIQVLDDVVRISGEYKHEEVGYLMQELPSGSFERNLRLPASLESEKVEARIIDGVLTLRLPKAESARPKKIKVITKQ